MDLIRKIFFKKYNSDEFCINTYNSIKTDSSFRKVIFMLWTGKNELTENRKKAIDSIKGCSGIDVELVTVNNISQYILPEYPLHPAYEYLSSIHKSDYLRCYLMHYYGGGYSDIKQNNNSWLNAFSIFENDELIYGIGYREVSEDGVSWYAHFNLMNLLKKNYNKLIGNGSFIIRPNTPFTHEWISEVNRRLDYYYFRLKNNSGNTYGDNKGYPISWTELQGDIFHPLVMKYSKYFKNIEDIKPSFENYR